MAHLLSYLSRTYSHTWLRVDENTNHSRHWVRLAVVVIAALGLPRDLAFGLVIAVLGFSRLHETALVYQL